MLEEGYVSENEASQLSAVRLLEGLDEATISDLARACSWRQYADHEQIIDRQSDSTDVYFVVDGRVRVVNYSLSGKEITLEDLDAGSNFGELSALDGQPRSASVMSLDTCTIASLPQDRFLDLIASNPGIAFRLLRGLAGIIRNSTDRIMDLSTLAANNRV